MNEKFLAALNNWKNSGRRSVAIELGNSTSNDFFQVWVYDYDIMHGSFIKSPEELEQLDLAAKKKSDLEEQIALLAKLNEK